MKRAFTLIELMIVIAIIAIIAAIAIPNLLNDKINKQKGFESGKSATVVASGIQVLLLRHPGKSNNPKFDDPYYWICRIDNGEGVVPRYSEVTFHVNELRGILPKVER